MIKKDSKFSKVYKVVQKASLFFVIFIVLFLFYMFLGSKNEDVQMRFDKPFENYGVWKVNGEAIQNNEDGMTVKGHMNEAIVLEGVVPEYVLDEWGAMVLSDYCEVKVYVDDQLIYSFGDEQALPLPVGHTIGNIRLIAPIDKEMAGKRIVLIYTPYFNMPIDIEVPEFAHASTLISNVFIGNLFKIVVSIVIIVAMIIALALFVYQLKHENVKDSLMVGHFICFSVLSLLWLFCSSDLPQFMTDSSEAVSVLSFICLAALGIPFNGFCKYILTDGKRQFEILWTVGWILPIINIVGFATEIAEPIKLLYVTHVYIVASIIVCMFYCIRSIKTEVKSVLLLVAMGAMIVSAATGLYLFYSFHNQGYDGIAFGVGFVIFFILMVFLIGNHQFEIIAENKFIETYKDVAYKDVLTNLENRTSIESRFESMTEETMAGKMVTLILFNMNGLHVINDSHGHSEGDSLLMDMAACVRDVFGTYGTCYRVGGDEMAVVLIDMNGQEEGLLRDFDRTILKNNKDKQIELSVSYGYSARMWHESNDFFRDMYKEAYASLKMMKANAEANAGAKNALAIDRTMFLNNKDSGTDLYDKGTIINYTMQLINSSPNEHISIAIIDLDDFKNINDTYGHAFGDEVLRDTAKILKEAVGDRGMCGRIGGDEMFIVFKNDGTEADVRSVLRPIKNDIGYLYRNDPRDIQKISCSIGSAMYPDNALTYDELFMIADKMLYLAKEKGKNRYIYYLAENHQAYISGGKEISPTRKTISKFHKVSMVTEFVNTYATASNEEKMEQLQMISEEYDIDSIFVYDLEKGKREVILGECSVEENGAYFTKDNYLGAFREDKILPVNNVLHFERKCPFFTQLMKEMGISQMAQFKTCYENELQGQVISFNRNKTLKQWAEMDLIQLAIMGSIILNDPEILKEQ